FSARYDPSSDRRALLWLSGLRLQPSAVLPSWPHIQYGEPKTAAEAEHALDLVHYEVTWELTEWKKVPSEAILKVPNPTGSPVICHSTSGAREIWCFIPDNQF